MAQDGQYGDAFLNGSEAEQLLSEPLQLLQVPQGSWLSAYLHISGCSLILYYLASSFIWAASHPTTHPSNPIIPSTCRSLHPSFIPSSSYPHIHPHLSIFSFRHPYSSPSSHPPTIYTPSIHPAISTLQSIHSSTYPTSIPINPPSTHSPQLPNQP